MSPPPLRPFSFGAKSTEVLRLGLFWSCSYTGRYFFIPSTSSRSRCPFTALSTSVTTNRWADPLISPLNLLSPFTHITKSVESIFLTSTCVITGLLILSHSYSLHSKFLGLHCCKRASSGCRLLSSCSAPASHCSGYLPPVSCPKVCGIFPNQGWNLGPLQGDS